jgi:1-acyl-sn-glycerol-3-phosphate acyltransferase
MARKIWTPPLLWAAGVQLVIEQTVPIRWDEPHIFVMNHQSMLDIGVAFVALPVNLRFIAKKELLFVPFLGWYLWATGMIGIDRSNSSKAAVSLRQAARRITHGASILAFPEGTRTRDGTIKPFKKGIFRMAQMARVPIVPVAIAGAFEVLPADSFKVSPGVVRLKIGAPIVGDNADMLLEKTQATVAQLYSEIT